MYYCIIIGSATVNVGELSDAVVIYQKLRLGDRSYGEVIEAAARSHKLRRDARSCVNFFNCCFPTELHQTETSEWMLFFSKAESKQRWLEDWMFSKLSRLGVPINGQLLLQSLQLCHGCSWDGVGSIKLNWAAFVLA